MVTQVTFTILIMDQDGIVYPSLDPSIFELKYPQLDIERNECDSIGNTL